MGAVLHEGLEKLHAQSPRGWYWSPLRPRGIALAHLHLLMPTLVLPANQGSSTKTHRKVDAPARPSLNEGLSCSLSPLRNQWTVCFLLSPRIDVTPWPILLLLLPVIFSKSPSTTAVRPRKRKKWDSGCVQGARYQHWSVIPSLSLVKVQQGWGDALALNSADSVLHERSLKQ